MSNGKGSKQRPTDYKRLSPVWEGIDWRKERSSHDWKERFYPDVVIIDPDGFDRSSPEAYEKSWNELVTKSEFENRLWRCTVKLKIDLTEEKRAPKVNL